jgi:hypothetical protein
MSVDPLVEDTIARLRAAIVERLSGAIDDLLTGAVAEIDAAVERARAAGQAAMDVALSDLREQARQRSELTDSVRQLEIQIEELRGKLQAEEQNAKTAALECEKERFARARAEAVSEEAQTLREQLVSAHESRLRAVQAELDAERAQIGRLKQRLEKEDSDRAKLLTALKTVQQACALADSSSESSMVSRGRAEGPADHESDTPAAGAETCVSCFPDATEAGPKLKLVAPSQQPAVDAPPELIERVKQLFDQVDEMYRVDCKAHPSPKLVEILTANLRYAHGAFAREVGSDHGMAETLFKQELSARLDAHGATSLGRHLAIAAYELESQESQALVPAEPPRSRMTASA